MCMVDKLFILKKFVFMTESNECDFRISENKTEIKIEFDNGECGTFSKELEFVHTEKCENALNATLSKEPSAEIDESETRLEGNLRPNIITSKKYQTEEKCYFDLNDSEKIETAFLYEYRKGRSGNSCLSDISEDSEKRIKHAFSLIASILIKSCPKISISANNSYAGIKNDDSENSTKYYFTVNGSLDLKIKSISCGNLKTLTREKLIDLTRKYMLTDAVPEKEENHSTNTYSSYSHGSRHSSYSGDNSKSYHGKRCPYCFSRLELKHGRYGAFYGCTMWPACDYTEDA